MPSPRGASVAPSALIGMRARHAAAAAVAVVLGGVLAAPAVAEAQDVMIPELDPPPPPGETSARGRPGDPAAAAATPSPLDEVVVLAARRPQPLREAAASTSVINASDLAAYGWRDFLDAIASLAGLYTTDPRDATYVGVRGVSVRGDVNGRVLILVDGHTQQELWSHSAYPELLGLDATMIDHIEVLRGPASALYGSLGFLAIINVVTRRPLESEWAHVSLEARDATLARASATVGHRFRNGLELGLAAQAHASRGDAFTYPDLAAAGMPATSVRGADAGAGLSLYGHAQWRGLSLRGSWQAYDKHIPLAPYGTVFNDTTTHFLVTRGYVDGAFEAGGPQSAQLTVRGFFDTAGYVDDLAYAADATHPRPYVFHDEAHPYWTGAEARLVVEREWWDRLHAVGTVGGDVTWLHGDDTSGERGAPPSTSIARALVFASVYGQAELTLARRVALTVGLRGDFSDTYPSELSPRAGLLYFPTESTTLKALYAHGFIHPSWYETFFDDQVSIVGNAALRPERADNFELVWQQRIGRPLFLTASAYSIRGSDLIEQQAVCVPSAGAPAMDDCAAGTAARLQAQNTRSFESLGGELGVVGRFASGLRLYASYGYAHATEASGAGGGMRGASQRAVNSPEHLAKAGVSLPLWRDHLVAGAEARLWSARRLSPATDDATSAFLLLAAQVTWRDLPPRFAATLRVDDLTGQTYEEPSITEESRPILRIPHPGPTVTLRLSYAY